MLSIWTSLKICCFVKIQSIKPKAVEGLIDIQADYSFISQKFYPLI